MKEETRLKLMFIIPSAIGVLLFMVPILVNETWTILVKLLADVINGAVGTILPLLCTAILTVSALMALFTLLFKPRFILNSEILKECFSCTPVWVVVRVLGFIFIWLTYLGIGADGSSAAGIISGARQGGVALDLIAGLVIIFAIASFLLPLLLDFGLLEFIGALLTK